MSIIEAGRKLYESGQIEEIKKETMILLEDFIGALSGKKLSIGKAICRLFKVFILRMKMLTNCVRSYPNITVKMITTADC